jgi:hypothetical protein
MPKKTDILIILLLIASTVFAVSVHAQDNLLTATTNTNTGAETLITLETFDTVDAWEHYSNPMGVELGVENGVYRAYTMNGGYVWGLNDQPHSDVILEVEATPLTIHFSNGFGIMCRADTNGDGYYFMINGNGYFSIRKGEGDYVLPLLDWQPSDAIRGEIDRNRIRAVCTGDYLAMYVNDEFVAEVTDATYSSGFAGLSVAAADNSDVDIAFDNLAIYIPTMP